MTRLFAIDLEIFCALTFIVAVFAQIFVAARLRLDIIRGDWAISGYEMGHLYGLPQLFRMHKLLFNSSWRRRLLYISAGTQLLVLIPILVLAVNDAFMGNNLLHLISRR
jgi:hypothetical protein